MIAVLSPETGRYAAFHQCLATLERPHGTTVRIQVSAGYSISSARNRIVEAFLASPAAWLWWIDDDHVFSADTLSRLLQHLRNDHVDAVVPMCLGRKPPFAPVVLSLRADLAHAVKADITRADSGLIEVGAAGGGGMLVRRRVFERVQRPWFRTHPAAMPDEIVSEGGEDIYFCQQMRQAGFRLFCDFDLPIGHITPVAVWPSLRGRGIQVQCLRHGSGTEHAAAAIVRSYPLGASLTDCADEAEALGEIVLGAASDL